MAMGFESMDDIYELAANLYFVQGDGRGLFPYRRDTSLQAKKPF